MPAVTATATESPAAPRPVSEEEAKILLREFERAQRSQLRALEHRQKMELRELKASQKTRQKEWEAKEREARHRFFKENTQGPARRAYIKEFLQRRKAMLAIHSDERSQRQREQEVRRNSLKDEHKTKLKELQEYLQRKERPPVHLWPSVGM